VGSEEPKLCWALYVYAERTGVSMAGKNRRYEVGFETHQRGFFNAQNYGCHVQVPSELCLCHICKGVLGNYLVPRYSERNRSLR